jgi:hypothetical protein
MTGQNDGNSAMSSAHAASVATPIPTSARLARRRSTGPLFVGSPQIVRLAMARLMLGGFLCCLFSSLLGRRHDEVLSFGEISGSRAKRYIAAQDALKITNAVREASAHPYLHMATLLLCP